jgi:hypothetical protein
VFFCFGTTSFAADSDEIPLNFDTQLLRIFEAAQTAQAANSRQTVSTDDRNVLMHILEKFKKHQMMLKNVVYRTDQSVIRITWADGNNDYIVKVAFKTGKDPILGNSVYADKRRVTDAKIMYRTVSNTYEYLQLLNIANGPASSMPGIIAPPQSEKPTFEYRVVTNLTNENCRFCHILARNDGSPSGVFFPRYQEAYKEHDIKDVGSLFRAEHFISRLANTTGELGLPEMHEDFLYQKVSVGRDTPAYNEQFMRVLIELPQLVEVMARDNKKSVCVAIVPPSFEQEKVDYICADNAAQRLSVKLSNSKVTANKDSKVYSEPYFEKK